MVSLSSQHSERNFAGSTVVRDIVKGRFAGGCTLRNGLQSLLIGVRAAFGRARAIA